MSLKNSQNHFSDNESLDGSKMPPVQIDSDNSNFFVPNNKSVRRSFTAEIDCRKRSDATWKDDLWKTHELVNRGAAAFADWILTLKGGISHELANFREDVDPRVAEKPISRDQLKQRRIVCSRSWLSVESKAGAPQEYVVENSEDLTSPDRKAWKTVECLRSILQKRGVAALEIEDWINDCSKELLAAIRPDSVWVNRSEMYDQNVASIPNLNRRELWDVLHWVYDKPEEYFRIKALEQNEAGGTSKDVESAAMLRVSGWISERFGVRPGRDIAANQAIYSSISDWAKSDLSSLSGKAALLKLTVSLSLNASSEDSALEKILDLLKDEKKPPKFKGRPVKGIKELLADLADKNSITTEELEKIEKRASRKALTLSEQLTRPEKGSTPLSGLILGDIEARTGLSFTAQENGKMVRHSDEFSLFFSLAARQAKSNHSNTKNAIVRRDLLEKEAMRFDKVPADAAQFLDSYAEKRSELHDALQAYQIRWRAVDGWKELLRAISELKDGGSYQERLEVLKDLQADEDTYKMGDARLFEDLLADQARSVWATYDPNILLDYVAGKSAETRQREYLSPSFRHPDSIDHPVYCEYGGGAFDISYHIQKFRGRTKSKVSDRQGLTMGLWDGTTLSKRSDLVWRCKRMRRELNIDSADVAAEGGAPEAMKNSRLARRAANLSPKEAVTIPSVLSGEKWNGRLQLSKYERDKLRAVRENPEYSESERESVFREVRRALNWKLSLSIKLRPAGPWPKYARDHGLDEDYADPESSPHAKINKERKGQAKLMLQRLEGVRVLGVKIGQSRSATARIVEAIGIDKVRALCDSAGIEMPSPQARVHRIPRADGKGKILLTRLASDQLPDRSLHSAPWGVVDKSISINLSGENDGDVRKASPAELLRIETFRERLSYNGGISRQKDVLSVMTGCLRVLKLGLNKHGDIAKIAYGLIQDNRENSRGEKVSLNDVERRDAVERALLKWYSHSGGARWPDPDVAQLWQSLIAPLITAEEPEYPKGEMRSAAKRKEYELKLKDYFKEATISLLGDPAKCQTLHSLFADLWRRRDLTLKVETAWLKSWIQPDPSNPVAAGEHWHKGGVSLARITALVTAYQLEQRFRNRPEPEDPKKNTAKRGETVERFGRMKLDLVDQLKRTRSRLLASRLAEVALGYDMAVSSINKLSTHVVRSEAPARAACHAIIIENLQNYRPDETQLGAENRRLMRWCARELSKELKARCQDYGLMFREVSPAYTAQMDSLTGHAGIRVRDFPAADLFTKGTVLSDLIDKAASRQDKGRASEFDKYLLDLNRRFDPESGIYTAANSKRWLFKKGVWSSLDGENAKAPRDIKVPWKNGGEIFVSADLTVTGSPTQPAAVNAATNIALRALIDPDSEMRWSYVPCTASNLLPLKDRVDGTPVFSDDRPLRDPSTLVKVQKTDKRQGKSASKRRSNEKSVVNLWRDVACGEEIAVSNSWETHKEFWGRHEKSALERLRRLENI